jgi:hypothetical protein
VSDAALQRFEHLFGPEFGHGKPFSLPRLQAALDAQGNPVPSTLRTRAYYLVRPPSGGSDAVNGIDRWRFRAEIPGANPEDMASRIGHMTCRDLLWEYDFMHGLAPKAKLQHEEVFQVAFAMFIAARRLGNEARDSLLAQWDLLIGQTLDSCRAQPAAAYWRDAFVHTFESAAPVGVNVQ